MHWLTHHLPLLAGVTACLLTVSIVALAPLPLLREPIIVTRGHLFALALFIGLLGGGAILLGQASLDQTRAEGAARRHDLRAQIERERARDRREVISRREVLAIARRTAHLERPTPAELLAAIRRAAGICRAHQAACLHAARGLIPTPPTSSVGRPTGGATPSTATPTAPGPGHRGPSSTNHAPSGAPSPGSSTPPPSAGTPTPTRPKAPVEITPPPALGPLGPVPPVQLPPLPQICTGVVNVNCTRRGRSLPHRSSRPSR